MNIEAGRRYRIEPKRDFGSGPGYWMPNAGDVGTGRYGFVKHGFVVTDGFCNIMPGATWFRTVADAFHAIAVYEAATDAQDFWRRIRAPSAA